MEQQQSSPLARRSWRAWEMSMGEGGLRRELFVVMSSLKCNTLIIYNYVCQMHHYYTSFYHKSPLLWYIRV